MSSQPSFWRKMWFRSWFKSFRPTRAQKKYTRNQARRSLQLERLEGRTLLSGVTVTTSTTALPADHSAIVIQGTGFDPIVANNSVQLTDGSTTEAGTVTAATSTTLNVTFAPTFIGGELDAVVTSDSTASTSAQVAAITPVVTASTDNLGAHVDAITINGYGFDPTSANDAVVFTSAGNQITGTITDATANTLSVTLPSDPTGGSMTATVTTNLESSTDTQVATVTPVVTSAVTSVAANATQVTITGYGFDTAGTNAVVFNDGAVAGLVTPNSATSLTVALATDPTTAGPLTAVVTTDSAGSGLPVEVASITPVVTATTTNPLAANATTFTINGFGFDTTVGNDSVTFNHSAVGTVTSATATTLTVTFSTDPSIAGALNAQVTVGVLSGGAAAQVATVDPVVTASTANLPISATSIVISGYGFDTNSANDSVVFNSSGTPITGTISNATANSLTVTIPSAPPIGVLTAKVTADTEHSTEVQVATVTPAVLANTGYLLPANASSVTIIGIGFDGTTASHNKVTFNDGAVAGTVTSASATSLTVNLATDPTTAGPLTAVVTSDSVGSGTAVQVAKVTPVVTNGTPSSLPANASAITINGVGFDPNAANDTVTFNDGASGTVTAATATALIVAISQDPTAAGPLTAQVSVNATGGAVSSGNAVQVSTVTPMVTASTANLNANAATLTIHGYGFNATTPSDNTVVFSGSAVGTVTGTNVAGTTLTVTFATAPTAGPLTATVTTNGQSGSAVQVATVLPVVLSNVSYKPAATATTLLINGYGFDANSSNDSVNLSDGAVVQTVTATSTNLLTVTLSTTPTSAGSLTAVVTTNAASSAPVQVALVTPVVTSSTTSQAAGSTTLTIAGHGFDPTAGNDSIAFTDGTGTATGTVTAATPTSLTVTYGTAPTVAGPLTAVVTNDGANSGLPIQVATVAPAVTSSTASLAANAATLVINGTDFDPVAANNTVVFTDGTGTAVGAVSSSTATSLTVTFSTKPTLVGSLTAVVTTDNVGSGAAVQVATVVPAVTASPANQAATASTIIIHGSDFDGSGTNAVAFNDGAVASGVVVNSSTSLTVTFSTKPTAGNLTAVVTTDGNSSGTPVQVAAVTPAVTQNLSSLAANASTLTIAGTGFDPAGANAVAFNDGAAGTVTAATATSLTVTFSTDPTTAGPLTATVTTDGAASGTAVQVATVAPVVTASTANLAANAPSFTISGFGFDTTASHDTVIFSDGAVGAVTGATANSLTVSLLADPAVAANLNATVTSDGVQGTSTQVAAITPVVLANSGYQLAANASAVIINGFGFDTTAAHNTVVFNDGAVAGTITAATATSLTVSFAAKPVTAGSLTAVVTTDSAASGAAIQVAAVAPFVTSSTASLAANSPTLTISGYGFNPTASGNTVTFNGGAAGTVTAATTTSLTVTFSTPPIAGNLTAVIHTNGISSGTAVQVATVTPAVTLSTAALAANSATINISGYGFDAGGTNTVTLSNGAVVSGVTVNSATSLTVTFSTKPTAGALTAVVTTDGQSSGTAVQVATVTPVVTSSVASLLANAATITISGYGFDPTPAHNAVVFSGAATGIVTAATATSLTVTFNTAPTGGNLTAVVSTNGASSASVQVATVAPVVTSSTANQAINATSVTINGFGFSTTPASNTVTFNDGATTGSISAATATSLTVTFGVKPTGLGSLTATVVVGGATSGAVQVATVTPVVTATTTNNLATSASQVTINGFGFDAGGSNAVAFNDGAVGTVTAASATALTVTFSTKPSAGNLTAVVTTDTVSSGSAIQVATVAPVVTASTANLANNAATITIGGSGFDPTPANNTVLFSNGAVGTVIASTATALTVAVTTYPVTAGALTAIVTTNGVTSGAAVQVATVAPTVTTSTVNLATNGASLVINGTGFDPTAAHNTVVFTDGAGSAAGTVTAATPTSLTVTFGTSTKPSATGSLTAVVTTDSQSSGTAVQVATVVASLGSAPTVTNSTANLAANAATITISGTNFTTAYANNTVAFNNGAVGAVTGGNATSLTVTFSTPPTAGSLTAIVTTEGVSSGAAVQVATVTPVVTVSTANQAINSGTLTINGFGFDPTIAHNTVAFTDGTGTAVGTVTAATATSLTVTFGTKPTATGVLNATVTTNSAAGSATQVATVVPAVTSSIANSAINATSITISGFGFSTTAANNTVTFNDGATTGSVSAATANSLTVTFGAKPTGLGSLTATVGVGGATSASAQVATVAPVVTQNTASLAANATTLTINGFGFDTTPGNNTVAFGNGAGVVTGATATSLTVTFSVAPTAGNLTAVVTTDGVSSGTPVQVATVAPVVTRSNATLAANSATLVINGFGFSTTLANNTVLFNGTAAGTVTAATATQLTVTFSTASKLTGGALTAVVTTNGVGSGTAVQVATVTPVVTSSVANLAVNAGTLTISGYGFDPTPGNNSISFNHGAIDGITAATATSLTVTFSTNPTTNGSLTAVVTTDGASSGGPVQVATVVPVVSSSTASLAPTASTITISGFGFDTVGSNTVTFSNGAVASGVAASTANSVTFTFSTKPAAGNLTAIITSNGTASGAAVQVATVAPVVTMSTANLTALTATQILINGVGFDPTLGNNTVAFNNGAAGTVTAVNLAKTQITVTFTTGKKPTTGNLTAIVTTNGVSSGVAVQVATVV